MPGNKPIPVKPLTSFIKGGIREHMFDLAHDVLDSLESRIIRLRDLEAFVIDIPEDPEIWDQHLIYRFDDVARYMERFQDVEQLVDEPLFVELRFGGEGLMDACKFDSLVGNLERDVEAAISRLEEYIAHVLGELPDEISSGKLRTENIELYRELVNLYGSSELPSLATSFESKSKDEVIKQAHGVLKTLQHLLDRASSLALECISSGENCFNSWETGGLGPLLDYAEHMFNLKQYIAYRGQVITKFMAGKFDRSATRLDCLLRAYILCYEDLPKEGTPWELDMPSLRATYYDMSMLAMCTQNKEDHTALKSLLDVCREVSLYGIPSAVKVAVEDLRDRANLMTIEKRRIMTRSLRKRSRARCGVYYSFLGTDFIETAYAIFHVLTRADIETVEKLISDVKVLKSE